MPLEFLAQFTQVLQALTNLPIYESTWNFLKFLAILLVSIGSVELLMKFLKLSKIFSFLLIAFISIWLYEQVFIKGYSLAYIVVTVITMVASLLIWLVMSLTSMLKKFPVR